MNNKRFYRPTFREHLTNKEIRDRLISYSEELLNYGLANYLEVLTARENMLNAQLSLVNTQYSRLNSMVQLYRAIGGGWQ